MSPRTKAIAAAPAPPAPKAPVVKKAKPVVASTGPKKDAPTYKEMIVAALLHLKDRSGSSRQALKKYIAGNYKIGEHSDVHLNAAIKRGVETGDFVQPKGQSGPLKLAKKEPKKKVVKEKKEPKEKKAKKPSVKKAAVKKDGTKATPKKAAAPKEKKATAPKEKKAKATPKAKAVKA